MKVEGVMYRKSLGNTVLYPETIYCWRATNEFFILENSLESKV
jgi:hypothetical protein